MNPIRAGISSNKVVIPMDTPLGRELFNEADPGDSIDITLGRWKHDEAATPTREGAFDTTVSVPIAEIHPDAGFPNITTGTLPRRIIGNFPNELLREGVEGDEVAENPEKLYVDLQDFGFKDAERWIEITVERLIKRDFSPEGVEEETYVFDDAGELVPKSTPESEVDRANSRTDTRSNPSDSASRSPSFCAGCGEKLTETAASFCPYCGKSL